MFLGKLQYQLCSCLQTYDISSNKVSDNKDLLCTRIIVLHWKYSSPWAEDLCSQTRMRSYAKS